VLVGSIVLATGAVVALLVPGVRRVTSRQETATQPAAA
jgi:hypothetical protein